MGMIGRQREKEILMRCLKTDRPQFVAVLGRRRVGKTFLIREFFRSKFAFYSTGISDQRMQGQLRAFHENLRACGDPDNRIPQDWFEAFSRLRACLSMDSVYRDPVSGKRVIFLDELPWMDTPKSDFRSALDFFWNSWGSSQNDLMLIVCGSATSWMIQHLLDDHGGFHNRVTRRIHLMPLSLAESEELLKSNHVILPRIQLIESYMIFGGIPYYLNLLDERCSLVQNIEELCFKPYGDLHNEYDNLIRSLFKKPEKHLEILKALSGCRMGLTRKALSDIPGINGGSMLTKALHELEQSSFIRSYQQYPGQGDFYYQLTDPFTLFALHFLQNRGVQSWTGFYRSPAWFHWRGISFELVCLHHISQIKSALGISGMDTREYSWQSFTPGSSAQIDLLIDRKDGMIHLCEMKFTDDPYEMTKSDYDQLQHRLSVFLRETHPTKALNLTLVSACGVKEGKYTSTVQNIITGDALFSLI